MSQDVLNQAIGTFFGLAQAILLFVIGAAIKMYFDVKQLKRDMNSAHKKLRELENGTVGTPKTSHCKG